MKKTTFRIPDDVHEKLVALAKFQSRKLNDQILWLIREAYKVNKEEIEAERDAG